MIQILLLDAPLIVTIISYTFKDGPLSIQEGTRSRENPALAFRSSGARGEAGRPLDPRGGRGKFHHASAEGGRDGGRLPELGEGTQPDNRLVEPGGAAASAEAFV